MSRIVNCVVLKREATGLDAPPIPVPWGCVFTRMSPAKAGKSGWNA